MVINNRRLLSIAVVLCSLVVTSIAATNKKDCCCPVIKEHCKPKHHKSKFCKEGADITQLNLTPVNITVAENYPDNGQTINLVAKIASQYTGGKNVLFLHGFPHCHLLWKNQLRPGSELRTKHNLYTLDFRGQGESDKPAPSAPPAPDGTDTVYRPWQNYANDIHQAILQLGLTDPNNKPVLVAHSAGVFFLNDYLRMFDATEISGIILVASIPDPFNTLPTVTQWFSPEVLALASTGDLISTDLERFIPSTQEFVRLSEAGATCKLTPNDREEILMYDAYVPGPLRNAIINHDGLPPVGTGMPGPNDPVWAAITVPTLVIHGVNDHVILFAAGEHLAQVIPTATLKPFKPGSHFPQLQNTKKFNKVLLKFLKYL